jgi:hypothetical protein
MFAHPSFIMEIYQPNAHVLYKEQIDTQRDGNLEGESGQSGAG